MFLRNFWYVGAAAGEVASTPLARTILGEKVVFYRTEDGRPVVFVSNHSSWLDVAVLGGRLPACFVAKEEVGKWPVISTIARLGRTLYVRRSRGARGRKEEGKGAK